MDKLNVVLGIGLAAWLLWIAAMIYMSVPTWVSALIILGALIAILLDQNNRRPPHAPA